MKKVDARGYIDGVLSIYDEKPTYAEGHDGSDGFCDCIGMCRGGLKRAGATGVHDMRGTNQAARKAIDNLHELAKNESPSLGDVVLRVRDKDDPDMPLPDKYRKGGSEYDPDVGETNFTHIGTVTKTNPIEITHMTSPTAKKDKSLKGWSYSGRLPWVEQDNDPEPEPEPGPEPAPDPKTAVVTAETGKTVNMRQSPRTSSRLVERVPVGETVDILDYGEEWCHAKWKWFRGYMMTKFLLFEGQGQCTVTIPGLTLAQATALIAEYPAGYITAG